MQQQKASSTAETVRELAQQLCETYTMDFHRVDKKLWGPVLQWLVDQSQDDVAKFAASRLALAYPEEFFQTREAILSRMPPPCDDTAFAAFRDDVTREVQIIPRKGASAVAFGFCGNAQKLGLSLNLMHRWFGQLGAHVVY